MAGPDVSQNSFHGVAFKKAGTTNNFISQFDRLLCGVCSQRLACQNFTGNLVRRRKSMILIDSNHIPVRNACQRMLVQHLAEDRRQLFRSFCRGLAGKIHRSVRETNIS